MECLAELTYSAGRRDVWQVAFDSGKNTQKALMDIVQLRDF